VSDDQTEMELVIKKAISSADMIISSGGVSVGDYDYIDEILERMGANIHVCSVAIKPGKPLTVASLTRFVNVNESEDTILYFGVPGNPVSAMVIFWRFIRGAIAKLNGSNSNFWYPQFIKAITAKDLHAQGRRETYLWGQLTYYNGNPIFQPINNYSSG
ncbi:MAG: molybdopterin-binding protein, partial [Dolichospermum sp.]